MMKIDLNLLKEVRETTSWLLAFPDELVSAVLKPRESYLCRRDRIDKLKEIVEIREIGKAIQRLYLCKGNLVHWIEELQSTRRLEDIVYLRELFKELNNGIAKSEIRFMIHHCQIQNWDQKPRCF